MITGAVRDPDFHPFSRRNLAGEGGDRRNRGWVGLLFIALLLLGASMLPLFADTVSPAPAPVGPEDFGQYLAQHEDDLDPFFSQHAGEMANQIVTPLLWLVGRLVLVTMLMGWIIDMVLSRVYANFFAPGFAKFYRSLIYATGSLIFRAVYSVLLGLVVVVCLRLPYAEVIIEIVLTVLLLAGMVAQVLWVLYLYRTAIPISAAFYITLAIIHGVLGAVISRPLIGSQLIADVTQFVDQTVTPQLQAEVAAKRKQLAVAQTACDAAHASLNDAQGRLAAAQAEAQQLSREIEAKKNSPGYLLGQIIKVRAQGNLTAAREQFTAFIARFSSGPENVVANAQLQEVDQQIAAQQQEEEQQQAETQRQMAQARADFLARAAKGQVSLSEMRETLIDKTRDQVRDLLGPPASTASDQWSYTQQMIVDPLTNLHYGLTVYFVEGVVQSVDYNRKSSGEPQ